ncbi:MAG: response regulator [Sulfitobacter sp.]|nr:response regulator [Sulfitobacter sp.]
MAELLMVDDSPTMQNLVRSALEKRGHVVHTAANGAEGLEKLSQLSVPLAIVDINMPKLNGYQMVRSIRGAEATRNMAVIFLTTETSDEAKARMKKAGANAWIRKPFDNDSLAETVQALLDMRASAA